jgi:hypothetical protein
MVYAKWERNSPIGSIEHEEGKALERKTLRL